MDGFTINADFTDEAIAHARGLIGKPLRIQQYNHEACLDSIRHYCNGIGDDNPLYCDPDYAATSPFGVLVAPPTFYYSVFSAGITPGFAGLQAFFGSGRFEINRLARRGESIKASAKLADVVEAKGKRTKRMFIEVGNVEYRTADNELLATYTSKAVRAPRTTHGSGMSYSPREMRRYTDAELDDIERQVLSQTRQGSKPLYWEDVQAGDVVPTRVKGPLNMAAYLSYYAGNLNGAGYTASDLQFKVRYLAKHNPDKVPNNRSLDWLQEPTWPGVAHTDDKIARSVGMPGAYDNGWNRVGWVGHMITDWIGDHGSVKVLEVRAVAPNLMGDTLWCKGKVTQKSVVNGENLVDVEVWADNQEGTLSCKGQATVSLPSKK